MRERRPGEHAAAALRYSETDDVPVITASGLGKIAELIESIAEENDIPVIRDAVTAHILVGQKSGNIPEHIFPAVAEILAYCYRTDKRFAEKMSKRVEKARE
jgi:type III secretion system FlhB-like substrate exporter